jgi:hypothetical protein
MIGQSPEKPEVRHIPPKVRNFSFLAFALKKPILDNEI